jgi:hypothetical protein
MLHHNTLIVYIFRYLRFHFEMVERNRLPVHSRIEQYIYIFKYLNGLNIFLNPQIQ